MTWPVPPLKFGLSPMQSVKNVKRRGHVAAVQLIGVDRNVRGPLEREPYNARLADPSRRTLGYPPADPWLCVRQTGLG